MDRERGNRKCRRNSESREFRTQRGQFAAGAGDIVALSLILTGTGYAYWTDTLNVTTKATTGDLEVTFADLGLYAQYANETKANGWSIVDGVGETSYVADAKGQYTTGSTQVMNNDNDDTDSQGKSLIITMDLDWEQFNVGKDTGNANILEEQNR